MKILNNIYTQFKSLSWLAVRIMQATLCIFCVTLLGAVFVLAFPHIAGGPVNTVCLVNDILDTCTRLLTLGMTTAFASDIVIRM